MNPFSCCIIGQGKLTISCASRLLAQGHTIHAMVSTNRDILAWAAANAIPATADVASAEQFLSDYSYDYLFSIINPNKVPAALLKQPKQAAINFHDAPLPRYAGLHVTSWALINRENRFGVTWHEMSEDFDAGDILRQTEFDIDADETAFSLNVKCFQYGEALFDELLNDLSAGKLNRRPQDPALRTSFLSTQRPDAAAILDWHKPADELEAMVRALSYQPDPNPIGMPKVFIGQQCLLLQEAVAVDGGEASGDAAEVVGISANGIEVATASGTLLLKSFAEIDGSAIELDALIASTSIAVGDRLPQPDAAAREHIHALDHRYGKTEKYWLKQFESAASRYAPYSFARLTANPDNVIDSQRFATQLDAAAIDSIKQAFPEQPLKLALAALFIAFLHRTRDQSDDSASNQFAVAVDSCDELGDNAMLNTLFTSRLPLAVDLDGDLNLQDCIDRLAEAVSRLQRKGAYSRDMQARWPEVGHPSPTVAVDLNPAEGKQLQRHHTGELLTLELLDESGAINWCYNAASLATDTVEQIDRSFAVFLSALPKALQQSLASVSVVDEQQRQTLLQEWNATDKAYDQQHCIHQLIESQAATAPDSPALSFRDSQISFAELNARANSVASQLIASGVGPDIRVGLFINRSIEMVVGLLAILKAGGAYVPLDPAYPRDRVALMIEDANAPILLTVTALQNELPANNAQVLCLDTVPIDTLSSANADSDVKPHHLAYVIYTSGSTGRPKGVMVEHRNVMNFFAGMDDTLEFNGEPGVWLAVTSISFDISVLEIFWSLSRGFKVVIQEEDERTLATDAVSAVQRKLDVGLFYFSSDAGPSENNDRYKLLIEGAKFADQHQFSAVWTPERHFHLFGGLYPNPSVTSAAIAAVTSNIAIRAGSIVLPLHNPVRVAEEWSVVDNLSNGRVGFSFASGWHANDFSLLPANYEDRKAIMYNGIETIRKLWSGESITMSNGEGNDFTGRIYPEPVQAMPPMWITTAGNVDSFRAAGEGGFNVLTNLLGQSIDDIREKINAYREGRKAKGHQGDGHVSVMVHTFVGDDVEKVREIVRKPFSEYLKTSFDLVKIAPWAFPAFRQPSKAAAQDSSFDPDTLTEEDLDALLDHAFDRYFETAGIFGTPTSCIPLIDELKRAGVDEIACLIDFGVDDDLVLESLQYLDALRQQANPALALSHDGSASEEDYSVAAQIRRHQVTHFQCTPSMARILSSDADTLDAWRSINKTLLGGEALPTDLAQLLGEHCQGEIINVYGPTETTIWSTSCKLSDRSEAISIGRPIANTLIYILDQQQQLTPIGVPGELYIGGAGVVRGYLDRQELTDERFIANPFAAGEDASRIYRTGDLARYLPQGEIEYLGRLDHQVKLRGYRIELGEIESVIVSHPVVKDCVVVAPTDEEGVQKLLAYVVPAGNAGDAETAQHQALAAESVSSWQTIWDETYQAGSNEAEAESISDPMLNFSGWLDSFSGENHPASAMREWIDHTADRIVALKPRRVLEIGCGTGMVLYRVAPQCEQYTGIDLSSHALSLIAQHTQSMGWENIDLHQGSADDDALLKQLKGESGVDVIVINSVAQYFPSAAYLADVIERAGQLIAPGGNLFIGDVRNYASMDTFHHAIAMARSAAETDIAELKTRVDEIAAKESELLVAPEFFYALQQKHAQISNVNVQLKRGEQNNEMSAFRYDVTISFAADDSNVLSDSDFKPLDTVVTLAELKQCLADNAAGAQALVMRGISNARLAGHCAARRAMASGSGQMTVAQLQTAAGDQPAGLEPEQVYNIDPAWRVELDWASNGDEGCFDAFFIPADNQRSRASSAADNKMQSDPAVYCHQPTATVDTLVLTEQLKASLAERVPEFMVPDGFIMLDALPLTPNGKIDRNALPSPEKRQRQVEEVFVAPEGDVEQTIAEVLREMLNLEQIGTRDNFFNMGANSLLIVQANNRLSQRLGRKVSLVSMYRYPTIAALAEHISGQADQKQSTEEGQKRAEKRKAAQAGRRRRAASRRR